MATELETANWTLMDFATPRGTRSSKDR